MTRDQFVEKWRHEVGGMILDAVTPREGAHAAMFVRQILKKVDAKLAEMHGDLTSGIAAPIGQTQASQRTNGNLGAAQGRPIAKQPAGTAQ